MNPNESPLIPQGSFLEQKNKGRARVKIAVFVVLAIHGVGLMALLMQGCKPSTYKDITSGDTNTIAEAMNTNFPSVEDTNTAAVEPPSTNVPTTAYVAPPPPTNAVTEVAPPTTPATEHKIQQGDTFAKLAQQYHVTRTAIQEANPGVEATKLKIGQTIKIPAATSAAATTTAATTAAPANNGSSQAYTVKSGDTLIKIGSQFGVSPKAIRTANNLTTDKIRVGQHLKIPAKTGARTAAATPDTSGGATSAPAGSR
jgi:LysM repeat protein